MNPQLGPSARSGTPTSAVADQPLAQMHLEEDEQQLIDVVAPGDPASDTHLQAIELLRDPSHVRDYRVDEWSKALQQPGFQIRGLAMHDLPMEFRSWVERMRTPRSHVDAILSLQDMASVSVRSALSITKDGSFTIRVATFELEVPPVP